MTESEDDRARMVQRARDYFADPANVEAYRAEASEWDGADAPTTDDPVGRSSQEEWEEFKTRALAELCLTYAELEQQAHEGRFTSTAARELWIVIGDKRPTTPDDTEARVLPDQDLASAITHAMDHPETLKDASKLLELDDPQLAAELKDAREHPERRIRRGRPERREQ